MTDVVIPETKKRVVYPVVKVAGTDFEMGRQVGEERRGSIVELLDKVRTNMLDARVPFGTGLTEPELLEEADATSRTSSGAHRALPPS